MPVPLIAHAFGGCVAHIKQPVKFGLFIYALSNPGSARLVAGDYILASLLY